MQEVLGRSFSCHVTRSGYILIPLLSSLDRTNSGVMNGPYSPVSLSRTNAEKRALDGKSDWKNLSQFY